jgi:polyphosphate kinase
MNNPEIMEKLIECSQAGVQVELFIRGICCLRPGIPGKTENITVKSVVGRWLEHSRVYCFGEGEDERLFIGSGDLLNRNLERRVEAFVEIRTPETREQIHEILNALREDREKSRTMQPDGSYIREPDGAGTSSQERLYQYFSRRRVSLDEEEKPEPLISAPAGSIPVKPVLRQRTNEADRAQKPVSAWDRIKKLFG